MTMTSSATTSPSRTNTSVVVAGDMTAPPPLGDGNSALSMATQTWVVALFASIAVIVATLLCCIVAYLVFCLPRARAGKGATATTTPRVAAASALQTLKRAPASSVALVLEGVGVGRGGSTSTSPLRHVRRSSSNNKSTARGPGGDDNLPGHVMVEGANDASFASINPLRSVSKRRTLAAPTRSSSAQGDSRSQLLRTGGALQRSDSLLPLLPAAGAARKGMRGGGTVSNNTSSGDSDECVVFGENPMQGGKGGGDRSRSKSSARGGPLPPLGDSYALSARGAHSPQLWAKRLPTWVL